ncbi:MAG TPA: hypothetical protein VGF22_21110 [Acidimicrobiales bacterium]|jgi:hypothetical protein
MSVKRLALVVLAAVGALAATTSPAFALSATADTTWMTNGKVFALARSGNTLYVGGKYAQQVSPDGLTKIKVKSLGRYDATTGDAIPGWAPKITEAGKAGTVNALAVSGDGSVLYVGGNFDAVDGVAVTNFAAVSTADGSLIPGFQHKFTTAVHVILWTPTDIYVGGAFQKVDAVPTSRLAAIDSTTGNIDPAWAPAANNTVRSMALATDGTTMFIGGIFTTMNGVSRQSVARVSRTTGALDAWAIPAGTIAAPQTAWALLPTANRLYGGFGKGPNYAAAFRLDNGTTGSQVWRFNTVGNVESLAMSNDGTRLFMGGHFGTAVLQQTVCGQPLHGLMSVNPATGGAYCDWFPAITPFGSNYKGAWTMLSTGTKLYVGGLIDAINGVTHVGLARFPL